MIGRLRGEVVAKHPPLVVLDVGGVGYEVLMPMTCFYDLPELGQTAQILTHFVVREDAHLLYGFNAEQERALFRELIKVNGVGPKLALAILSRMSAVQFIQTVEAEDSKALTRLPGVGTKTAERLVVEMKDRFKGMQGDIFKSNNLVNVPPSSTNTATANHQNDFQAEASAALVSLGYKPTEASKMINATLKRLPELNSAETLIKEALRAAL
ncbi:Holliday junction branch migration protein RuvA [Thorsellia anophelis]|uniref:Holliday junction branch migration complex subunit RuvA n=1 Tax=Thorsellia anophelis DSM 18579 TaxID=1123402 RepID=A0A1I0BKV0_9GAMM|nr:Holliday junction branch migration protein RuvA [Thorsellia anophelis]SET06907.1 Holliday junction DNA helicase subunit RuvA [Thorsellia anophelis DSM 18579]